MQKVTIEVRETLTYARSIDIEIPDEMTEVQLDRLLCSMEKDDFLGDAIYVLKHAGITVDRYDEDMDSPDSGEIEVIDFEFKDNEATEQPSEAEAG